MECVQVGKILGGSLHRPTGPFPFGVGMVQPLDWEKINETLNTQFDQYRISEALMTVYTTFRDEFSSWLLEMIKPAYGQPIDRKTYEETLNVFEQLLQLLHPFMPFITEEIWQTLRERQDGESIMISRLPKATKL